jgi:hypothetical protein
VLFVLGEHGLKLSGESSKGWARVLLDGHVGLLAGVAVAVGVGDALKRQAAALVHTVVSCGGDEETDIGLSWLVFVGDACEPTLGWPRKVAGGLSCVPRVVFVSKR